MKKVLLAALLLSGALGAYAQTKGTNSVGLGVETMKNKAEYADGSNVSTNSSNFSLRYANFIKDNVKLGIGLSYVTGENGESSSVKGSGASFLYQKYYPVYKKLYVFVGGEAGYSYLKNVYPNYSGGILVSETVSRNNNYSLGVYGGASYFLGKHWELEARILSANINYSEAKNNMSSTNYKATNFSLKTAGAFTNLGFSINFLF